MAGRKRSLRYALNGILQSDLFVTINNLILEADSDPSSLCLRTKQAFAAAAILAKLAVASLQHSMYWEVSSSIGYSDTLAWTRGSMIDD